MPELSNLNEPLTPDHAQPNQFALMQQRRFAPFFWTQFFGAANDNLFKFAFTVMVTYHLSISWLPPAQAGLVIGACFILPFLLFSATSGQLADQVDKVRLMRWVKNLEIGIMVLAAVGFVGHQIWLLLVCTFLMGLHSTIFGPVKYAYLPAVLNQREITGGNGMVEMGTFVAILLGNMAGGLLVALPQIGHAAIAVGCLAVALIGRWTAQQIPLLAEDAAKQTEKPKLNLNPFTETWRNLKIAAQYPAVFRSLLGISWMWFFGAVFLSLFPSFAKDVLRGNEHMASFLLVVFSLGIGVGSLLCELLSKRHVEIGLVPIGALGMSVFAIDLYFAVQALQAAAPAATAAEAALQGVGDFWEQRGSLRVVADLALLALFAGLYSVPMYVLIQLRSPAAHTARIIAANNILNAVFMIASSLIAGALLGAGYSIPQVFLFLGIANAVVVAYIFWLVPEYFLRCVAWVVAHCAYRFKVKGDTHIPQDGAALLICNHVSFADAVLLMAASPRPIRFVMDSRIFRTPVLGWFFRANKAIPIAPKALNPVVYERAFAEVQKVLADGEVVAIFPEGSITPDGVLQAFKGGLLKIVATAEKAGLSGDKAVPVVPMALNNMWGSFFSRVERDAGGKPAAMRVPFRRGFFSPVVLKVGAPLQAPVTLEAAYEAVRRLHSKA